MIPAITKQLLPRESRVYETEKQQFVGVFHSGLVLLANAVQQLLIKKNVKECWARTFEMLFRIQMRWHSTSLCCYGQVFKLSFVSLDWLVAKSSLIKCRTLKNTDVQSSRKSQKIASSGSWSSCLVSPKPLHTFSQGHDLVQRSWPRTLQGHFHTFTEYGPERARKVWTSHWHRKHERLCHQKLNFFTSRGVTETDAS